MWMHRVIRWAAIGALFGALSACQHVPLYDDMMLVKSGPGQEADAKALQAYAARQDEVVASLKALAADRQVDAVGAGGVVNWDDVIAAGMEYSDSRCAAYMQALFALDRNRKTATSELGILGTATAGILAATKAAARDVALTAIGFGVAASTVDTVSGNVLFDLDPSAVQTLVMSLQQAYRKGLPTGYGNRPAAMSVIRDYSMLCVPSRIEAEVNAAVKASTPASSPGDARANQPPAAGIALHG